MHLSSLIESYGTRQNEGDTGNGIETFTPFRRNREIEQGSQNEGDTGNGIETTLRASIFPLSRSLSE